MSSEVKGQKLTGQQQRVLKLLFKFRFVSAGLLADVMGIRKPSAYEVLEQLLAKELVVKVYNSSFRIDRRPAYYYLNKTGVTTVRKVMDVKESVVHALYKNDEMTDEFVEHCLKLMQCYVSILATLPEGSNIFSKSEINRFTQFPKTRPDLYIRTPDGKEAMIVILDDKPQYIVRKRLDEILEHSEEEGWDGDYPRIGVIVKDTTTMHSLLYTTEKKLESMGIDEGELTVLVAPLVEFSKVAPKQWTLTLKQKEKVALFE